MEQTWSAVDAALEKWLLEPDEALDAALAASEEAGLPAISVTPVQGKLLQLIAAAIGARRILEFGTLGGYSTIWLARALPAGGRLTTLERDPSHADVARRNLERAGVADRVEVLVGAALETVQSLAGETFDFTFIDADKPTTPAYFDWAVAHSRPGALVVADNVVRRGGVLDDGGADANVEGVRRFLAAAGADPRVSVTALQTVGAKGYDGMAVALVR